MDDRIFFVKQYKKAVKMSPELRAQTDAEQRLFLFARRNRPSKWERLRLIFCKKRMYHDWEHSVSLVYKKLNQKIFVLDEYYWE